MWQLHFKFEKKDILACFLRKKKAHVYILLLKVSFTMMFITNFMLGCQWYTNIASQLSS